MPRPLIRARRRFILGTVVGLGALGLRARSISAHLDAPDHGPALARLVDCIAPGGQGLPSGRAVGADERLKRQLRKLDGQLFGQVGMLLDEIRDLIRSDRPCGDAELTRWQKAHPDALAWAVRETYLALYASARHGGAGERGAFATLAYP